MNKFSSIGLLTYFRLDNAGQYMQALATLRNLDVLFPGSKVEIVNAIHEKGKRWRVSRKPSKFLSSILKHFKYERERNQNFKGRLSTDTPIPRNREAVFNHLKERNYDLLVVGSDTCLKVDHHYKHDLPIYWLDSRLTCRKIMLSSSAEFNTIGDFTEQQISDGQKVLEKFDFLGVRDQMTSDLLRTVSPASSDKVRLMPDPTIGATFNSKGVPFLQKLKTMSKKKLCGINLQKDPFTMAIVQHLSLQYHVVSINGFRSEHCDLFVPGPRDWLNMYKDLDLMVTSSFHEAVFSLKNGIPVFAIDSPQNRINPVTGLSKTSCLFESIGMTGCYINPFKGADPAHVARVIHEYEQSYCMDSIKATISEMEVDYHNALQEAKAILER